jgi:hypothetical protein
MERTVPSTASDEVELYQRTYYSLLRSTADVQIRSLEEVHAATNSLLHPAARKHTPDMSALIYSLLRLPGCIHDVERVVLGQSLAVFESRGLANIESWEPVSALARRRRCFFDGKDTLACFIASRSDIDDMIPLLTAYQIEWNKLHTLFSQHQGFDFSMLDHKPGSMQSLANILQLNLDDLGRLRTIWGKNFVPILQTMAQYPRHLRVQLLSGSFSEYRRATNLWWELIEAQFPPVRERPVYFISSNTHSIPNLLTGHALEQRDRLLEFLYATAGMELQREWRDIQEERNNQTEENFLYYLLKKFQASPEGKEDVETQRALEKELGFQRIPSVHSFDVEAQLIELRRLDPDRFDPRLFGDQLPLTKVSQFLRHSDALIVNIDYPLGLSAYNILSEVADQAGKVLGVYVMGKAASLNGVIGDMMIPNVVHDEHSRNTYMFSNAFSSADVAPFLSHGTVLDNQKAVTVRGTFLQNASFMDVFYREGYSDIEMEAGPYLSATYEMFRPQRHPVNEIVNLYGLPFDLGIIHYVSDTPLSKGRNLGVSSLSYSGMDPTYAATVAILRRILSIEMGRQ